MMTVSQAASNGAPVRKVPNAVAPPLYKTAIVSAIRCRQTNISLVKPRTSRPAAGTPISCDPNIAAKQIPRTNLPVSLANQYDVERSGRNL
jgi:hypothetical protein